MALIRCADCDKDFSDAAAACPNCGRPNERATAMAAKKPVTASGCAGVGCLTLFILMLIGYAVGDLDKSATSSGVGGGSASSPAESPPVLELQSWSWHTEYDYAIVEGTVTNISSRSLANVQAVVTFQDGAGGFITSDDALLQYNPILPGQTSPFKVMARHNPAMKSAGIDFKVLMGGTLRWREREPKKRGSTG